MSGFTAIFICLQNHFQRFWLWHWLVSHVRKGPCASVSQLLVAKGCACHCTSPTTWRVIFPPCTTSKGIALRKSVSFSINKKTWLMRPSNFTGNLVFLMIFMLINKIYTLAALQPQISHSSMHYSISNIQYIWMKFKSSWSRIMAPRCQYLLWCATSTDYISQIRMFLARPSNTMIMIAQYTWTTSQNSSLIHKCPCLVMRQANTRECLTDTGAGLGEGTQCVQRKCFMWGKRFSILPIITLDSIIAHDIIESSVTTEKFVDFLRELVVLSQFNIPWVLTSNLW